MDIGKGIATLGMWGAITFSIYFLKSVNIAILLAVALLTGFIWFTKFAEGGKDEIDGKQR